MVLRWERGRSYLAMLQVSGDGGDLVQTWAVPARGSDHSDIVPHAIPGTGHSSGAGPTKSNLPSNEGHFQIPHACLVS
jgi:hypothetical protein